MYIDNSIKNISKIKTPTMKILLFEIVNYGNSKHNSYSIIIFSGKNFNNLRITGIENI